MLNNGENNQLTPSDLRMLHGGFRRKRSTFRLHHMSNLCHRYSMYVDLYVGG